VLIPAYEKQKSSQIDFFTERNDTFKCITSRAIAQALNLGGQPIPAQLIQPFQSSLK
jgi:hypothetical protein